ncbi:MAG: MFS transporter [Anaerolineae bacterium]|nr:MFS transporter [Anaerolineae bacterium]MDW8101685.1 MFS transporter [Anaerolineae bacterium]
MKGKYAKIAYGIGNMGTALFFHTIGAYIIFFYTDVVRLDPKLVGLAFAISYGVWNAINDPLVGYISDRTRTRWGRRIPYILFGAPLLLFIFILVWSPPLGGKPLATPFHFGTFLYFAILIALFDLLYTAVSVPYISLFPEMYETLPDRTEVSIYRQVAAMIGSVLAFASMPLIADALSGTFGRLGGWAWAGAILGLIGSGAFLVSLLGSRERKEFSLEGTMPLTQAFKATLTNQTFLAFVGANLMICYIWSWLSAMVPFFTKYVIGAEEGETGFLFLAMFVTSMAFYPLWRKVALRLGSRDTLAVAVPLFVALLLLVFVVRNLLQALAMMFLLGAANSGITLVRDILLSDVIDEDELRTGRRREGIYFGVNAFIERFAMVLVGGSSSLVLGLSGYNAALATQPPSVAVGIRMGMSLLPLVALVIFLTALKFYPLGKEQVIALRERLNTLHQQKAEQYLRKR